MLRDANFYRDGVRRGDRRVLAQAITLIESQQARDESLARDIVGGLLPATGGAIRLGITGTPGVGKSTLIESLGLYALERGHRVAVLAVDPSSPVSGGSILGDKTRMARLAQCDGTFIRPSPSGSAIGGISRKTRETLLLCEAANFDVIVVETVGIGQSERAVADMTDVLLLLLQPGAGDALQGMKRGILELADIVAINKADGELLPHANAARNEYQRALELTRDSGDVPAVLTVSALETTGIGDLWDTIAGRHEALRTTAQLDLKRREQRRRWLWHEVEAGIADRLRSNGAVRAAFQELEDAVVAGEIHATEAARRLLERLT